jgi:hypothetical protein
MPDPVRDSTPIKNRERAVLENLNIETGKLSTN